MFISPEYSGGIAITDAESVGLQDHVRFYGSVITEEHAFQAQEESRALRTAVLKTYEGTDGIEEFMPAKNPGPGVDTRILKLPRGKDAEDDEEIVQGFRARFDVDCTYIYLAAQWLADAGRYSRGFDSFRLFFTNEMKSIDFHYDKGEDNSEEMLMRTILQLSGVRTVSFRTKDIGTVSSVIPVGDAYELAVRQVEHSATYKNDCVALYIQGTHRRSKNTS